MKNPFRKLGSRQIFRNPYFEVRQDDVIRPNGEPGDFTTIRMKAGASVLAFDEQEHVYLVEEFKYAVDRPSIEVVSGGIDPGEEPLAAAQRELREEAGFTASEWIPLGTTDPFTTILVSPVYLYVARGLESVGREPDEGEVLRTLRVPFARAIEMVMDGGITHAPSCLLLLKAGRWLERKSGRKG